MNLVNLVILYLINNSIHVLSINKKIRILYNVSRETLYNKIINNILIIINNF
jgi:hypothetical protein